MELLIISLLAIILVLIILLLVKNQRLDQTSFEIGLTRIESSIRNEIATNRSETNNVAKLSREELSNTLKQFGEQISSSMKDGRKELSDVLESFKIDSAKSLTDFNASQKESFFALLNKQSEQNTSTSTKLDQMRDTIEKKITEMQAGNEKKLDEMRVTVDEKLQKTLESRLGESFKLVSERLEAVHKGLGDMQQLATGVGDLKRVLSNVKTRGILGEYQLENILEQILTQDQYGKNVKTKAGSNDSVEFAIKLPGHKDNKTVWLPVDSKFPKEPFELLAAAYEQGSTEQIELHRSSFIKGIKKCAMDISSKYIDPPNTTDFAILFLPFESLYAEVLRTPGLFETLQREYKIIITGPTTLSAILNSLHMGFRTLAIEKRSSEVWELLGAVKTQFGTFGSILEKTQKKLKEASNVIEQAGVKSRSIERQLKSVQQLPMEQAIEIIGNQTEHDLPENDTLLISSTQQTDKT